MRLEALFRVEKRVFQKDFDTQHSLNALRDNDLLTFLAFVGNDAMRERKRMVPADGRGMVSKARRALTMLVAVVMAAVFALGATGCNGQSAQGGSGTLKVGVRSDIVNFGLLNEQTGKYYGLEIDIAEEMAERMGYADVEYVTVTPEDRKEMLLNGEVDALVACYSIADTRLENFDFSPAYYTDHVIAVVENSSLLNSIDDMKGLTFGTMSGANAAPLLNTKLQEIGFSTGTSEILGSDNQDVLFDTWHLVQYPSYQELSDALEQGEVDAMVLDGAIAQTYMNDDRSYLEGFEVAEQSFGVATQKGSDLSGRVAEAVQSMLDDGTIATLTDKWN